MQLDDLHECLRTNGLLSHDRTSCYHHARHASTFVDAQLYCQQQFKNSTLPLLTNEADEQILLIALDYNAFFWIGVHAVVRLGELGTDISNHWIDGQPRNLSKWDIDEINDEFEIGLNPITICAEASLLIDGETIGWTARDCNSSLSVNVVCERKLVLDPVTTETEAVTEATSSLTTETTNATQLPAIRSDVDGQGTTLFDQALIMLNVVFGHADILRVLLYIVFVLVMIQLLTCMYIVARRRRPREQCPNGHNLRRCTCNEGMSVLYLNDEANKQHLKNLPPNTFVVRM